MKNYKFDDLDFWIGDMSKQEILKELVIYSTKKGLDLTKTKDLNINVINFSCVLNFKNK